MTNNHKTILSVAAIMLLVLTLGFTLFPRLKTGSPVADFTSPFTVFPTGSGTVFINLSQGNPSQWTWIFDSGNPDTSWNQVPDSVFYTSPGYYDVTLIVSNAYGADTLVRENFVRVYDPDSVNTPPVAGFTASKRLFMQGSTIYFFDTSSNYPCSWQWTIENAYQAYITSALQNPYGITFLSPGLFDVSLVVSNAYGADSVYRENYIVLCDSMWPPDDLCDTISNVPDFTENIGFLTMEQTWGYFPGHNGAGIIAYADKYTDDSVFNLTELLIPVRKTYPATGASSIRIKVWQGDSVPETEIASKQVPLNQLYPNTFCLIDFDSAISLSGDFFVGFELDYNPALQDTFVITMHNDRGPGGLNTAYILQDGVWRTPHDYSVYYGIPQLDITTSLFLPVISCPLGIEEHKSDREHLLLVYPNPTTGMLMMETGTSPGNNYRIELYDLAGRAHFPPAVRSGNVLCTDIGTYPEGIYIARVYYGNFSYSCKVVLAK